MHIALFHPQIPANTGNIIRLCANTGAELHLIHPLGFVWDDKRLRRAGMDYEEFADVKHHDNWADFASAVAGHKIWALTTKGHQSAYEAHFGADDVLLFGSETAGLEPYVHAAIPAEQQLRIPMQAGSRCLNLSNSVAVMLYEALRQSGLPEDPVLTANAAPL